MSIQQRKHNLKLKKQFKKTINLKFLIISNTTNIILGKIAYLFIAIPWKGNWFLLPTHILLELNKRFFKLYYDLYDNVISQINI